MSKIMGIGALGTGHIVFHRKFRWTVAGDFGDVNLPETFAKVSARPSLDLEEIEVKTDENSESYFPDGEPKEVTCVPKEQKWNTISTTYYDVGLSHELPQTIGKIWSGLADETLEAGTLYLRLYDGAGNLIESWVLREAYPISVDFGELDHSSSESVDIEITWKYKSGTYRYEFQMPEMPIIHGFKTPEHHIIGGPKDNFGYYVTPSEPTPPSGPAPTASTS